MGRPRTRVVVRKRDRIPPEELQRWMKYNGVSINQLAVALSSFLGWGAVKHDTVQGWLRNYRPAPAWLEHRINFVADHGGKLPRFNEHWHLSTQMALSEEALRTGGQAPVDAKPANPSAIEGLLRSKPPLD